MPRPKRNPRPAATSTPRLITEPLPARHAVRVRTTCPLCGMMPEVERLQRSPYPAEVRVQRFGGSFPATDDQPMTGFMRYDFGTSEQLRDAIGLFLLLIADSRQALLELLPAAYQDAGLEVPQAVASADHPGILAGLPDKAVLFERLLAPETVRRA